jgi:histidinol-phosphate/aromatic aminotransferase/cobyric acid decarboxylase-like protein
VTVVEGEGNFLSLLTKDVRALHAGLLEQGVVVRQFFHKDPDHVLNRLLRISVGSVDENERLLSAMARPMRHEPLCLPLLEGAAL